MPSFVLESAIAERLWLEIESLAESASWTHVMSVVKRRLNLDDAIIACAGWPVRLVLEADEPGEDANEVFDFVFSIESVPDEDRNGLLAQLKEGYTVIWKLLEGLVLLIPSLSEEEVTELSTLLGEYSVSGEKVVESALVDTAQICRHLATAYRSAC